MRCGHEEEAQPLTAPTYERKTVHIAGGSHRSTVTVVGFGNVENVEPPSAPTTRQSMAPRKSEWWGSNEGADDGEDQDTSGHNDASTNGVATQPPSPNYQS